MAIVRRTKRVPRPRTFTFTEYGYKPDGIGVPSEYLAHITSVKNKATITGILQENIIMRVESRWEPFIPTSMLAKGNYLLQVVTGGRKALVTRAATRRLWTGSTPMTMFLKLRFEAIDDSFIDVVEPCRILQSMAVPSEPTGEVTDFGEIKKSPESHEIVDALQKLPALSPPGPTPFTLEGLLGARRPINELNQTEIIESAKGGDRIILQLGKFLQFDNVILREATSTFHIQFDPSGDPISAEMALVFETYEMPTAQSLQRAYQKASMVQYEEYDEQGRKELSSITFG